VITHAARILKYHVEAIEVKVWTAASDAGQPVAVRLFATADQGWECVALREKMTRTAVPSPGTMSRPARYERISMR
jgi:hypothetical protein